MFGIKKIKIVTHDSRFHADDVFAYATLMLVYDLEGVAYQLVRTRDEEVIAGADIVFDTGGIYDPETMRFDHHQVGGAGERANGIPYAAFGLIWKHFGHKVVQNEKVWKKIDEKLVQSIDAHDNGKPIYTLSNEKVKPFVLDTMVGAFNSSWTESDQRQDEMFFDIAHFAKKLLSRVIKRTYDEVIAEEYVVKAYDEAPDKRIVVLDGMYPWKDIIRNYPEPLFVVSQRNDGKWNIGTIQSEDGSFKNRKDLPVSWAGMRDQELESITGVNGAVFCHRNLFLAVAENKDAAVELAKLALEG